MNTSLRVIVVDDERPARSFLAGLVRSLAGATLVGEAASGSEAVELIERERPDLALLDLQMPEIDGLSVVRLVRKQFLPLIAFVTAYDEYAVRAFEINAIDYLLKPVEPARLRQTINRAQERLEFGDVGPDESRRIRAAAVAYETDAPRELLRRIPVRRRDDIVIVLTESLASIVADGELLHLTTSSGERHTISYRLKDLERRLDPSQFVRVSRSALVNLDMLQRVSPMPGGTYLVTLTNKQQISVSRIRGRILREQLLKL